MSTSTNRRLSAVLIADIAGYTRLIEENTDRTVSAWKSAQYEVIDPAIEQFAGRIVKYTGDGFLAEFGSVQNAVDGAIALRDALADSELRFRIGVALGDVLDDGRDIHGEGVNLAARIESLCEAGEVCVTGPVYDTVKNQVGVVFADIGKHKLKNVTGNVQVYQTTGNVSEAKQSTRVIRNIPTIAVLPFKNLSGDPDQNHFCEGITEEILTALSKINRIFVVAKSSLSKYRDGDYSIEDVAREQDVRYLLEGSVRRAGDRIRVAAQLIDSEKRSQCFAERYDHSVDDLFAVQDEITREITTALQIKITDGEQARLWTSGTNSFEAWELCVRATELIDKHDKQDTAIAQEYLDRALTVDPNYATAWCKLGWAYWSAARHYWVSDVGSMLREARGAALKAKEIDSCFAEPLALLAMTALQEHSFEEAESFAVEAVEIARGQSNVLASCAMVLNHCGKPLLAIEHLKQAIRLCPIPPGWYLLNLGRAYYLAGDLENALPVLQSSYDDNPTELMPVLLIAALRDNGNLEKAKQISKNYIRTNPNFSIAGWKRSQAYSHAEVLERLVDALLDVGMPE